MMCLCAAVARLDKQVIQLTKEQFMYGVALLVCACVRVHRACLCRPPHCHSLPCACACECVRAHTCFTLHDCLCCACMFARLHAGARARKLPSPLTRRQQVLCRWLMAHSLASHWSANIMAQIALQPFMSVHLSWRQQQLVWTDTFVCWRLLLLLTTLAA
jgi:hypothetical protein